MLTLGIHQYASNCGNRQNFILSIPDENLDYKLNYILAKTNVEVDLIVERPGRPLALIEIKSTNQVNESHISSLEHFAKDFPGAQLELWSQDPNVQKFGRITAMPWQQGVLSV